METFALQSICFAKMRHAIKKHQFIIVGGPQKVGKSTLLKTIFGMDTAACADENTRDIFVQSLDSKNGNIHLMDVPGIDDKSSQQNGLVRLVLFTANAIVGLVDILNANNKESLNFYNMLHQAQLLKNIPYKILLTKCDYLYAEITENLKTQAAIEANIAQVDIVSQIFMENDVELSLSQVSTKFWNRYLKIKAEIAASCPLIPQASIVPVIVSPDDKFALNEHDLSPYDFPKAMAQNTNTFLGLDSWDSTYSQGLSIKHILGPRGVAAFLYKFVIEAKLGAENARFISPYSNTAWISAMRSCGVCRNSSH